MGKPAFLKRNTDNRAPIMSDSKSLLDAAFELSRLSSLSRRGLLQAAAGLGAVAAFGFESRPAHAATTMTWMGWQGYETPIKAGTFLKDNDIDFQPTFISSNEEIITKLQAGGVGKTDLITMYFGYLPLMAEAGLLEPIDPSRIGLFGDLIPQFTIHGPRRHSQGWPAVWRAVELGLAAADVRSRAGGLTARKLDGPDEARVQGQGRHGG
jgi:hypothetical protein